MKVLVEMLSGKTSLGCNSEFKSAFFLFEDRNKACVTY